MVDETLAAPPNRRRPRRLDVPSEAEVAQEMAPPVEDAQSATRPPMHDEMPRQPLHPDTDAASLARADARAEQILGTDMGGTGDGTIGEYDMDLAIVPAGWVYGWKTRSVLNQENPSYTRKIEAGGWGYVPASRHPEMLPVGSNAGTIERSGLVLMERPKKVDDRARMLEESKALGQVRIKEQQLAAAPPGTFARDNKDGTPTIKVGKEYKAIQVPK